MLRSPPHPPNSMLNRIPLGQEFRFLVQIIFNIELGVRGELNGVS